MLLNNDQVKGIISELKEQGYSVGMKDISYVLLCRFFQDHQLAFRTLFQDQADLPFELYDQCDRVIAIGDFLDTNYHEDSVVVGETKKPDETISFDELKKGLVEDMKSLEALRDMKTEDGEPALDAKEMATVVGRIADLRVKLTEKYGATQKEDNHRVIVVSKYTKVCPHCGREY